MHLDWLDEGSVQLMLPERLLSRWQGVDTPDYERACVAASDWLNQITVGDGVGFVLGGDEAMAAVVHGPAGTVTIVRWVFAEDEHELVAFALGGGEPKRTEADLAFDNVDAAWCLFDAASDPRAPGCSSLAVTLPLGRVRAQTSYVESERNAAIPGCFKEVVA